MKNSASIAALVVCIVVVKSSPYRSQCSRIGNFTSIVKGYVLAGYVFSKSHVTSRIDCSFVCMSDQRCVSHNYEEGDKPRHECELNSESKETKSSDLISKPGYSYYGTGINVPTACASSPCINDGTCVDSCMKGSGYKCVCIDGRIGEKCQNWTVNAHNYTAVFSNQSNSDHLETDIHQTLSQFTVCMWLKTSTRFIWMTFLSLVTAGNEKDLKIDCWDTKLCRVAIKINSRGVDVFPFNNGLWHHLCVAWTSVTGDWSVILDGSLMGAGTNWRTGVVVGPGRLIVGQTHLGEVSSVNVWDRKMTNKKIKEMARSYSQELGNITDWRMFRHGVRGDIELRYPGSPVSIVSETEFVLEFPSQNINSYVQPSTVSRSFKQLTVSLWIKKVIIDKMAIFSYATNENIAALQLRIGSTDAFNLNVVSSESTLYRAPEIVDDIWHHLSVTWTNVDGKVQWFLDGVLKYSITGYQNSITVPGGGVLRIGQKQTALGGSHDNSFPFQGMLTRVNIWSTLLADSAIEALAKEPGPEIGDLVSWRGLRTSAFNGEVTAKAGANLQLMAKESDFDLVFASKATANYATYSSLPSLTKFTACLWMKTSHAGVHYFFSYSTSSYSDALVLGYNADDKGLYFNINSVGWRKRPLSSSFMHDSGWHHVCARWNSEDGKWCIYVNGDQYCETNYNTGQTIQGSGKFILGQEQDSYGGGFSQSQAFFGRISRMNIWNDAFQHQTIALISKGCESLAGNVVAWYHFKNRIFGDVQVETPSWCSAIGPTRQTKLDEYCQNTFKRSSCDGFPGTTTTAVFSRKVDQVGKLWRCYYKHALIMESTGYEFDTGKNSRCLYTRDSELRGLILE